MSVRAAVLLPAMFLVAACGGSEESTYGLLVQVDAVGASAGREVRITAVGETAGDWQGPPFERMFCTIDRDAFVSTRIRVEVREGAVVIADVEVERFACAFDPAGGDFEVVGLALDPDGTLHWQVGTDPDTYTGCVVDSAPVCSTVELR